MIIGIPKEIKNNENRVSLSPSGVHALVDQGHKVLVEASAGGDLISRIKITNKLVLLLWIHNKSMGRRHGYES